MVEDLRGETMRWRVVLSCWKGMGDVDKLGTSLSLMTSRGVLTGLYCKPLLVTSVIIDNEKLRLFAPLAYVSILYKFGFNITKLGTST